ncbi:hypothetical protein WJ883_11940, partial [Coxiella burnetii]
MKAIGPKNEPKQAIKHHKCNQENAKRQPTVLDEPEDMPQDSDTECSVSFASPPHTTSPIHKKCHH